MHAFTLFRIVENNRETCLIKIVYEASVDVSNSFVFFLHFNKIM